MMWWVLVGVVVGGVLRTYEYTGGRDSYTARKHGNTLAVMSYNDVYLYCSDGSGTLHPFMRGRGNSMRDISLNGTMLFIADSIEPKMMEYGEVDRIKCGDVEMKDGSTTSVNVPHSGNGWASTATNSVGGGIWE